jgi:serine/threonine protein kinase
MSLKSNSVLMQRYRILKKVGEGGFGLVYKAIDRKTGKPVAIKQITLASLSVQEIIEATDSYNREITLLTGLQHQNLPRLYAHFTDPEHWYVVMEYIEGETLEERLTRTGASGLPVKKVLTIGKVLADVLSYLHRQQPPIIYRDVKPANIMITRREKVYLIDFGIARRYRLAQSKDTGPLGSPGYAAPEQYGKAQTTPQTDIYGLGATLQTLLTGKEPFEVQPEDMQSCHSIPTELQELIARMMERDASKRPSNMIEVGQALQRIKEHHVRVARFVSPFAWLATLWCLFMLLFGYVFFRDLAWIVYFLVALCAAIGVSLYQLFNARRRSSHQLTTKEAYAAINKGLSRALTWMPWCITWSLRPLFNDLLNGFQLGKCIFLATFLIVSIGGMIAIDNGLPPFLKWLKRVKVQSQKEPLQTPRRLRVVEH